MDPVNDLDPAGIERRLLPKVQLDVSPANNHQLVAGPGTTRSLLATIANQLQVTGPCCNEIDATFCLQCPLSCQHVPLSREEGAASILHLYSPANVLVKVTCVVLSIHVAMLLCM